MKEILLPGTCFLITCLHVSAQRSSVENISVGQQEVNSNYDGVVAISLHDRSTYLLQNNSTVIGASVNVFNDINAITVSDNNNWLVANENHLIHSLKNPKQYLQPDTYKGIYWFNSSDTNDEVQKNIGVLNYWFYLLAQGGSGTNDKGFSYRVNGISITKAQLIVNDVAVALNTNAGFANMRRKSVETAERIYGKNSTELNAALLAWDAVGVTEDMAEVDNEMPGANTKNNAYVNMHLASLNMDNDKHQLDISFTSDVLTERNIYVCNLDGTVLDSQHIKSLKGNNRLQVNLPSLADGNYVLKIDNVQSGLFSVKH